MSTPTLRTIPPEKRPPGVPNDTTSGTPSILSLSSLKLSPKEKATWLVGLSMTHTAFLTSPSIRSLSGTPTARTSNFFGIVNVNREVWRSVKAAPVPGYQPRPYT